MTVHLVPLFLASKYLLVFIVHILIVRFPRRCGVLDNSRDLKKVCPSRAGDLCFAYFGSSTVIGALKLGDVFLLFHSSFFYCTSEVFLFRLISRYEFCMISSMSSVRAGSFCHFQ